MIASGVPPTGPGLKQSCALIGRQTSNALVHRLAPSPLSHTSQDYPLGFLILCMLYIHFKFIVT